MSGPILIAQQQPASWGDALAQMGLMFLVLFIALYWLVLRPGAQDRQRREQMLRGLKKNDRVVTTGGIFGVVTNVQFETREVTLRVDESNNTRIRVTLGAVARILGGAEGEDAAKSTEPSA